MADAPVEFVDTDVIIRHLTVDRLDQSPQATAYLEAVGRQEITAHMSEACVAEVVYVLASPRVYRLPRRTVASSLRVVLSFASLVVPNKASVLRALDLWEATNLDFEDALNVAHMERLGVGTIVSFDRHYDRLSQVARREP